MNTNEVIDQTFSTYKYLIYWKTIETLKLKKYKNYYLCMKNAHVLGLNTKINLLNLYLTYFFYFCKDVGFPKYIIC